MWQVLRYLNPLCDKWHTRGRMLMEGNLGGPDSHLRNLCPLLRTFGKNSSDGAREATKCPHCTLTLAAIFCPLLFLALVPRSSNWNICQFYRSAVASLLLLSSTRSLHCSLFTVHSVCVCVCVTFYPVVHSSSLDEENDSCSECLLLKSMSFLLLTSFFSSLSLSLSLALLLHSHVHNMRRIVIWVKWWVRDGGKEK